jgi:hypothetical protein
MSLNILNTVTHLWSVRTPLKGDDYFCRQVNAAFGKVEQAYLEAIKSSIAMRKADAMLGDGTVAQVDTFDPQSVLAFYQRLANALAGWASAGISKSATEDLRRLYCQFAKEAGKKYHIICYFGVQFHALPYYRVDRRVIEAQKELAKIAKEAGTVFKSMASAADKALQTELEKKGYANLEFQDLFTKMFDDGSLVEELDKKATSVESQFPEFEEMRKKKAKLFAELNDLLIELYQTSPVLMDYNRLMQGEEGVTTYFDIEVIKNKKTKAREAYLNTQAISKEAADTVATELHKVAEALSRAAR